MVDRVGAGVGTLGGMTSGATTNRLEWWRPALRDPVDVASVASAAPVLSLVASTWNGTVDVRIQVSSSPVFTTVLFDQTLTGVNGDGTTVSKVQVAGLSEGVTYYWRAKALPATGENLPWTAVWSFKVFIHTGDAVEYITANVGVGQQIDQNDEGYIFLNVGVSYTPDDKVIEFSAENIGVEHTPSDMAPEFVYLNVDTSTPNPVIWFLRPNFGREGDAIDIFGLGFGDLPETYQGVVEIYWGEESGWRTVPVVSWQTFPPTVNAYTSDRTLDEGTGVVDMQHTVLSIVVPPDAIPPGYPVRVRTEGP